MDEGDSIVAWGLLTECGVLGVWGEGGDSGDGIAAQCVRGVVGGGWGGRAGSGSDWWPLKLQLQHRSWGPQEKEKRTRFLFRTVTVTEDGGEVPSTSKPGQLGEEEL